MRDPRLVKREAKPPMASGRIAVQMTIGSGALLPTRRSVHRRLCRREERDALTEWVNVIAFTERCRHLLMCCSKGQLIAVMGGVTLDTYRSVQDGSIQISRTLVIEDMYGAAASIQPDVTHPADIEADLKERIGSAAEALPEEIELAPGEIPELD